MIYSWRSVSWRRGEAEIGPPNVSAVCLVRQLFRSPDVRVGWAADRRAFGSENLRRALDMLVRAGLAQASGNDVVAGGRVLTLYSLTPDGVRVWGMNDSSKCQRAVPSGNTVDDVVLFNKCGKPTDGGKFCLIHQQLRACEEVREP